MERSTESDKPMVGSKGGGKTPTKWNLKKGAILHQSMDTNLVKFIDHLYTKFDKDKVVITSGIDSDTHSKKGGHYKGKAIDIRVHLKDDAYNDPLFKYINETDLRKQFGIKLIDPYHGTAPHIHIESGGYNGVLEARIREKLNKGGEHAQLTDEEKEYLATINPTGNTINFTIERTTPKTNVSSKLKNLREQYSKRVEQVKAIHKITQDTLTKEQKKEQQLQKKAQRRKAEQPLPKLKFDRLKVSLPKINNLTTEGELKLT